MPKIIKVESCTVCLYPTKDEDNEGLVIYCDHPSFFTYGVWHKGSDYIKVAEYIKSKTMHPDCPLDDPQSLWKDLAIEDVGKLAVHIRDCAKRDATKHIRAVWNEECEGKPLDQEKHLKLWDGYRLLIAEGHKGSLPRDWFESILDYITVLETAIMADLKDKEAV